MVRVGEPAMVTNSVYVPEAITTEASELARASCIAVLIEPPGVTVMAVSATFEADVELDGVVVEATDATVVEQASHDWAAVTAANAVRQTNGAANMVNS